MHKRQKAICSDTRKHNSAYKLVWLNLPQLPILPQPVTVKQLTVKFQ